MKPAFKAGPWTSGPAGIQGSGTPREPPGPGAKAKEQRDFCADVQHRNPFPIFPSPALLAAGALLAAVPGQAATDNPAAAAVSVQRSGASGFTLEARQAPLARILDELGKAAGVRVKYSELPAEPRDARCPGPSVKEVLDCLLGRDADLVLEYGAGSAGAGPRVTAVTVLASTFAAPSSAGCGASSGCENQARADTAPAKALKTGGAGPEALFAALKDRQRKGRADALGRLIVAKGIDEARLLETLNEALADEDGEVRAQAVFGLSRHARGTAFDAMRAAIHDRDPSVRLMAVDSIEADAQGRTLLQDALLDLDATVREYAAAKLGPPSMEMAQP
jgi:hypothetical protein